MSKIDIDPEIIPPGYELVRITTIVKNGETYIGDNGQSMTWSLSNEIKMTPPVLVIKKKELDVVKMRILLNSFSNMVDELYERSPSEFEGYQELNDWVTTHENKV